MTNVALLFFYYNVYSVKTAHNIISVERDTCRSRTKHNLPSIAVTKSVRFRFQHGSQCIMTRYTCRIHFWLWLSTVAVVPLMFFALWLQLQKNDFAVNRFFMKLFNTSNIEIIKACQWHFSFELPSVIIPKRVRKFIRKFEWRDSRFLCHYFVFLDFIVFILLQ